MFNLLSTVWFGAIFILLTALYFQSISTVVKERKRIKISASARDWTTVSVGL